MVFTDFSAQLQPVNDRHHNIQHGKVYGLAVDTFQCFFRRIKFKHPESLVF